MLLTLNVFYNKFLNDTKMLLFMIDVSYLIKIFYIKNLFKILGFLATQKVTASRDKIFNYIVSGVYLSNNLQ